MSAPHVRLIIISNVIDPGNDLTHHVSGVGPHAVLDSLDPAVRERDHELALHVAAGVLALRLLEVCLGDLVGHGVLVGEWLGDLLGLNIGLLRGAGGQGQDGGADNELGREYVSVTEDLIDWLFSHLKHIVSGDNSRLMRVPRILRIL